MKKLADLLDVSASYFTRVRQRLGLQTAKR